MINNIHLGDCLEVMKNIEDKSIDMILCDLPYGTTSCKWDIVIDFDLLWEQYKRIIKNNACIALFGNEPFSSKLRLSNLKMYKYDWIWVKTRVTDFFNVKNKPFNKYEVISIFSYGNMANGTKTKMKYNPQGIKEINKIVNGIKNCKADKEGHKLSRPSHSK